MAEAACREREDYWLLVGTVEGLRNQGVSTPDELMAWCAEYGPGFTDADVPCLRELLGA